MLVIVVFNFDLALHLLSWGADQGRTWRTKDAVVGEEVVEVAVGAYIFLLHHAHYVAKILHVEALWIWVGLLLLGRCRRRALVLLAGLATQWGS